MRSIRSTVCHLVTTLSLLIALAPAPAAAQGMTVTLTHHQLPDPRAIDSEATYWGPAGRKSTEKGDMPPKVLLIEVPPTEKVCIRIQHANPLLYNYAVSVVEVKVDTSSAVLDLAKQLTDLAAKEARWMTSSEFPLNGQYLRNVLALADRIAQARALHVESDTIADFRRIVSRDSVAWQGMLLADSVAGESWNALSPEVKALSRPLRELQLLAMDHLRQLHERVVAASKRMDKGSDALSLCTPMPARRTEFGVKITARTDAAPYKPARSTSANADDVLARFTLEPAYVERFRVEPGLFIAAGFGGDRDVGVSNDVLTIEETSRTYTRTGVFAMARLNYWLWPTLGVAKAEGSSADVFLGLQIRAGNLIYGPQLAIGLGAAWMEVPVGAGALAAGAALPDAKKLEDVITRQRQVGFALTFTITGLKLGSGDKGDASADK